MNKGTIPYLSPLLWLCSWLISLAGAAWLGHSNPTMKPLPHQKAKNYGSAFHSAHLSPKVKTFQTFDPQNRPSFQFSELFDPGRKAVLKACLESANFDDFSACVQLSFSGLNDQGRSDALNFINTISAPKFKEAAIIQIFSDWSFVDPFSALSYANEINEHSLRSNAINAVWATWLTLDPITALNASPDLPNPTSIDPLINLLVEQSETPSSTALAFLTLAQIIEPNETERYKIFDTVFGSDLENIDLALDFWDAFAPNPIFNDHDNFADWLSDGDLPPQNWSIIRDWVVSQPDPNMRLKLLTDLAPTWIEQNSSEAFFIADSLPLRMRDQAHAAVFDALLQDQPDSALSYFNSLPSGDIRDYLVASTIQTWNSTIGSDAVFNDLLPSVESPVARQRIILDEALSYSNWYSDHTTRVDPRLILNALNQLPDNHLQKNIATAVYQRWAFESLNGIILPRMRICDFGSRDVATPIESSIADVHRPQLNSVRSVISFRQRSNSKLFTKHDA